MKDTLKALFVLALLFVGHTSYAVTYYAQPGGSTTGTCTDPITDVCTVRQAVVEADNGDTIQLATGKYPGSELGSSNYVLVSNENLSFDCVDDGKCIFQPSGAGSGIRYNVPTAGTAITIDGVVIERQAGVATDQCFWFSDATGIYDVTITDTTCRDTDFYDIRVVANEINLIARNNNFYASASYSPRSYLFTNNTWGEGSITIDGGTTELLSYNDTAVPIINIISADAGQTVAIRNWTAKWTPDPAISTGHLDGIGVKNVADAVIEDNYLEIFEGNGTVDSRMIRCYSTTAGLSSANCIIRGNTLKNHTVSGQMASVGEDQTSVGNGLSDNGLIEDNRIYCYQDNTDIHGAGIFFNSGGIVRRNYVENCGIGVISKDQVVGGLFHSNIINDQWQQGLYSKGSNGTRFINNTVLTNNNIGLPVVIGADVSTSSTNAVLVNNIIVSANAGTQAMLTSASSQTIATSTRNTWYGFATPTWNYLGTDYTSLASWNALTPVGTDLELPANFVGGNTPNTPEKFRTVNGSLVQGGTRIAQYTDYEGKKFDVHPTIGAWQHRTRDFVATRTPLVVPALNAKSVREFKDGASIHYSITKNLLQVGSDMTSSSWWVTNNIPNTTGCVITETGSSTTFTATSSGTARCFYSVTIGDISNEEVIDPYSYYAFGAEVESVTGSFTTTNISLSTTVVEGDNALTATTTARYISAIKPVTTAKTIVMRVGFGTNADETLAAGDSITWKNPFIYKISYLGEPPPEYVFDNAVLPYPNTNATTTAQTLIYGATTTNYSLPSRRADSVLIIGDSFCNDTTDWQAQIKPQGNRAIYSYCVSGASLDELVGQYNHWMTNVRTSRTHHQMPKTVIFSSPINDIQGDATLSTIQNRIGVLANLAKSNDMIPVFISPTPFGAASSWTQGRQDVLDSFRAWQRASSTSYFFVDPYNLFLSPTSTVNMVQGGAFGVSGDGLHPVASGMNILARYIERMALRFIDNISN